MNSPHEKAELLESEAAQIGLDMLAAYESAENCTGTQEERHGLIGKVVHLTIAICRKEEELNWVLRGIEVASEYWELQEEYADLADAIVDQTAGSPLQIVLKKQAAMVEVEMQSMIALCRYFGYEQAEGDQ